MGRRSASLLAALLAQVLVLGGCTSVAEASKDDTNLVGDVPASLGPRVALRITAEAADVTSALAIAIEDELLGRELFERVDTVAPLRSTSGSARLDIEVTRVFQDEVFDAWTIDTVFVSRIDLDVALRDAGGKLILHGRVTGLGIDPVTESDQLDDERRADEKLAAFHDAAAKVSRRLRRAAAERARDAAGDVKPIRLPRGVGPVAVAVIGFDDKLEARRLRGPELTEALTGTLGLLGTDVRVLPREDLLRALEDDLPKTGLRGKPHLVKSVAARCDAALFLVGSVETTAGRVSATVDVVDRDGKTAFTRSAGAEGLGALGVIAAELAKGVGAGLLERSPE